MGKVLRCIDERTGTEVAVKVIREDLEDPIHRHRFARECEAARRVRSRHVARALETGECPIHGTYLAMELLTGETLTSRLMSKGPMKVPVAIDVGLQLLDALMVIHAAGVVHRDLKPSNVHVGDDENGSLRVVLFDFGVCAIPGASPLGSPLTDPARPIGTLRYMAPEQIVRRHAIGPATDVYGWGCIMWVALTGVRPFPKIEKTSRLVNAIVKTNHAAPHTKRPELPRELSVLVARAMCVDPHARPRVAELRAALAEMADQTVDGMKPPRPKGYRPPPPPPPLVRLSRGKKPRVSKPRLPPAPRQLQSRSQSQSQSQSPAQAPLKLSRQRTLVGQPEAEPLRPRRVFGTQRAHNLPPGRSSLPSWQLVRRSATPTQQRRAEHAALTTVVPGELNPSILLGVGFGVFGVVIALLALAFS